jgi:hypothetical protein
MKFFGKPVAGPPSFRGIFILKLLFALAFVALAVSAITGVASVSGTFHRSVIVRHTPVSRLLAATQAPVYLAFLYGLHRRMPIVWRLGFAWLALSYGCFIWEIWATSQINPRAPPQIFPVVFGVVGGAVVTTYWWVWWRRQRAYFAISPPIS